MGGYQKKRKFLADKTFLVIDDFPNMRASVTSIVESFGV
jgi:hypothetical protein